MIGPLIAGRLYGRAAKLAMALRVPRPDGAVDVRDAALVRLAVDEVHDPVSGQLLQPPVPHQRSPSSFWTTRSRSRHPSLRQILQFEPWKDVTG